MTRLAGDGCATGPGQFEICVALPGISPTVAPSSVVQARARLGPDPMEWLFTICAEYWAHASARSHHWRGWELELGYDEIKTELLDREGVIRSRTPTGVQQELWGILPPRRSERRFPS